MTSMMHYGNPGKNCRLGMPFCIPALGVFARCFIVKGGLAHD